MQHPIHKIDTRWNSWEIHQTKKKLYSCQDTSTTGESNVVLAQRLHRRKQPSRIVDKTNMKLMGVKALKSPLSVNAIMKKLLSHWESTYVIETPDLEVRTWNGGKTP